MLSANCCAVLSAVRGENGLIVAVCLALFVTPAVASPPAPLRESCEFERWQFSRDHGGSVPAGRTQHAKDSAGSDAGDFSA